MRVRNVKIIWTDGFASIATRKSARRGRFVKSNVRTLAIYAMVKNLVRIKKFQVLSGGIEKEEMSKSKCLEEMPEDM